MSWKGLTEWRIYASEQHNSIAPYNGLSPVRRQAIVWTNALILSTRPYIYKEHISKKLYLKFKSSQSKKCTWKCLSKWRPSCPDLNVLSSRVPGYNIPMNARRHSLLHETWQHSRAFSWYVFDSLIIRETLVDIYNWNPKWIYKYVAEKT